MLVTMISFVVVWLIICSTRTQFFKLPHNKSIVLLGNSHIETGINDSILCNSFNFARSSDNLEQVYCKIKLLKRYNNQLDTVIIGYDNMIMKLDLSKPIQGVYSPYFYDTYTINDIQKIILSSSFSYVVSHFYYPLHCEKIGQALPAFYDSNTNVSNLLNLGRYEYLIRDKLDYHIKLTENKRNYNSNSYDCLSKYFMEQIIDYCQDNHIYIIFICPPQHKKSPSDKTFYKEYYNKNYSHIKFYDFRDMHLPDSCFGDLDHLNYRGAKVFSEYLEKEVLHKQNYTD